MKLKLAIFPAVLLAIFPAVLLGMSVFSVNAQEATPEAVSTGIFEVLRTYYAIENIPLEDSVLSSEENDGVVREKIQFRGFDREWVTGTLAIPKGVKNPPIVILLHGLTQSKDQWWSEGGPYSFPSLHRQVLVENGIAVLAIDARNHGERIEEKDFENAYAYLQFGYFEAGRKMIAETTIDVRRAIDYLETRDDVDATRLGVAGFSLGAQIAWIASAVDQRIDRSLIMAMPVLPNQEGTEASFTNPSLYFPGLQSPPMMMVAGKEDDFYSEAQMNAFFEGIASDDKEIVWVEGGHDLPDSTAEISRRFFVGQF